MYDGKTMSLNILGTLVRLEGRHSHFLKIWAKNWRNKIQRRLKDKKFIGAAKKSVEVAKICQGAAKKVEDQKKRKEESS